MKRVIALVAALQFVYILDFIMVLPLGPDLARALHFSPDRLGVLTAAYTTASFLSGLAMVGMIDRFDRRLVVLWALGLMTLSTAATAWASDLATLLLARAVTGLAGAPAIAAAMAMVIDLTPPSERGRALAKVMLGFSVAAVVGVPLSLEAARALGWQAPFFGLAALAALVWISAAVLLPRANAERLARPRVGMGSLLARPAVRAAVLVQALSQFSAFMLIPHFSAYFLLNLGFPRERLGVLYVCGGIMALVAVQVLGRLVDRIGALRAVGMASMGMLAGLLPFFAEPGASVAMLAASFVLFMAGNAGRNVSVGAALSQVPEGHERAGFMALQGLVQDGAITLAALASGALLHSGIDGRLNGMQTVAICAAVAGCLLPVALTQTRARSAPTLGSDLKPTLGSDLK
jgi:predicted MFS family arabinose efflux permease